MNIQNNKQMNLPEAIRKYVTNGAHMSIGGFTVNRNPMAAVHEMIRQDIRDLHLYVHSNGQAVDELIGGNCVSRLEIAYGANGRFAPTCYRFKKAVQEGSIQVEDYTNYQMCLRFQAGAMGVPFLPTCSSLGTDIAGKWGFKSEMRQNDPRLPDKKMCMLENPFGEWKDASKVVLVPAINPEVSVIHVQMADYLGNCRIKGLTFADLEQAKASQSLIVTCEELVETDRLKREPDQNQLPSIYVDAVVHVPFGAYPTACYGYYDYDPAYLQEYARTASDDDLYRRNREQYVIGWESHQELIAYIGRKRLDRIKADPERGYARGLDRR